MKPVESLVGHQLHHRDEHFRSSDNIPLAGAVVLRFFRRGFTASESESSSSELLSTYRELSVKAMEDGQVTAIAYHTTVRTSAALWEILVTTQNTTIDENARFS